MAMLLIAIGVMTVLWAAALPTWSQLAKREKEAELIFRGEQYARAIRLFQQRFANQNPPSLDVLIDQKFLRRKYEDPMVEDGEFQLLYLTSQQPGSSETPPDGGRGQAGGGFTSLAGTQIGGGGIIGVTSKSTELAIREYNGGSHYNEWRFVPLQVAAQPGVGGGGAAGETGGLTPPGPAVGGGRGNTLFGGDSPDRPGGGGRRGGRGAGPAGGRGGPGGLMPQIQPPAGGQGRQGGGRGR